MKATIVGANSYIARNLLTVLKKMKPECEVKLYDYADAHADEEKNYRSIRILEPESVSVIDMDCDIIFMFVGKMGSVVGFQDYESFIDVNEKGLLNLLTEYVKQKSKAKIVFPSTRLVYKGSEIPIKEEADKEYKTIYAMNKFACEQYLEQYNRAYNISYCIFRIGIPYGTMIPEASSYGTIGFMLERARKGMNISLYGDGAVRRTFTHIEDLSENLILGAFSDRCMNEVFNIGGEDLCLNDVAQLIALKFGVDVEHIEYPELEKKIETGSTVFDASKLASIGIAPSHSFREWIETALCVEGGGNNSLFL